MSFILFRIHFMKKLLLAFVLAVSGVGAFAASENGVLRAVGGTAGYDLRYPRGFERQIPTPGTAPIKLQSRFTWGNTNQMVDHAVVAYVQGSNPAYFSSEPVGFKNTVWRYGAGALVSKEGLNLELWFHPLNSTSPDASAYVWNAEKRSGVFIRTPPINRPPLGETFSEGGEYIEPLPADWRFVPGEHYWVRIALKPVTGDDLLLYAELFHENAGGVKLVQRAQVKFQKSAHLPLSSSASGAVARAPGSGADIIWYAFDSF